MGGFRPGALVTLRGAVFLGIGATVGAGIFALLGEAAVVARSAVWLFLLAGVVSALLGYTLVKLGVRYPSSALAFFAVDTARNAPETFAAIVGVALLAVIFDLAWKRMRGIPESTASQVS